jgi:hypothetical protein
MEKNRLKGRAFNISREPPLAMLMIIIPHSITLSYTILISPNLAESVPFLTSKYFSGGILALLQCFLPCCYWFMSRCGRIIASSRTHLVTHLLFDAVPSFLLAQLVLLGLFVLVGRDSCLFVVGEGRFCHDVCACAGCETEDKWLVRWSAWKNRGEGNWGGTGYEDAPAVAD